MQTTPIPKLDEKFQQWQVFASNEVKNAIQNVNAPNRLEILLTAAMNIYETYDNPKPITLEKNEMDETKKIHLHVMSIFKNKGRERVQWFREKINQTPTPDVLVFLMETLKQHENGPLKTSTDLRRRFLEALCFYFGLTQQVANQLSQFETAYYQQFLTAANLDTTGGAMPVPYFDSDRKRDEIMFEKIIEVYNNQPRQQALPCPN